MDKLVKKLKIAFRVDASLQIGTGHVMRCLTLAFALKKLGGECIFICRENQGNLCNFISEKGFKVYSLICSPNNSDFKEKNYLIVIG